VSAKISKLLKEKKRWDLQLLGRRRGQKKNIFKRKKTQHPFYKRAQSPRTTTFKMNSGFPKYSRHENPRPIMPPTTFLSPGLGKTQASPTPYRPGPEIDQTWRQDTWPEPDNHLTTGSPRHLTWTWQQSHHWDTKTSDLNHLITLQWSSS